MNGFLPWRGGKHLLSKTIVERIDAIPHSCYVEPFMGSAKVFFRREPLGKTEVLNDMNRDLVTLFRVLQWHLEEFFRYFKWALVARDEFERLTQLSADALTDIQRAAQFYYLQKLSFGGQVQKRDFGTVTSGRPRLNLMRMEEELSAVHLRLSGVMIERLPWLECIIRYDRPHTLFYIDPPYWGHEDDYGKELFERNDFTKLAAVLATLKGRFILSLNDLPEVREMFGGFTIRTVTTRYSAAKSVEGRKKVTELLISN